MKEIKKVIKKLVFLGMLVTGLNFIYKATLWKEDIREHADIMETLKSLADSCDVLYFGESSNFSNREDDIDKSRISDFISRSFTGLRIGTIDKGALHARIYLSLLRLIPDDSPVKTVIITLNLRSLSPGWIHSTLETWLMKSDVFLQNRPPLLNRFLVSLNAYDHKTDKERETDLFRDWKSVKFNLPFAFKYTCVKEWDSCIAFGEWKLRNGSTNQNDIVMAAQYVKNYAFQIDTLENPRIKDFDEIVKVAEEKNIRIIFNLLAENTINAKELVGDELLWFIRTNRDLLKKRYTRKNVIFVDNLESVPSNQFVDTTFTTEHYGEGGRKVVAANVAEKMKAWYPSYFREVRVKGPFRNSFEGDTDWGAKETVTRERFCSGLYSSKILKSQPFSPTFNFLLADLLPEYRRHFRIEMSVFMQNGDVTPKLVISTESRFRNTSYTAISLSEIVKKTGTWASFLLEFELPAAATATDRLKIYVWNPSDTPVFIDDLMITPFLPAK